MNNQIQKTYFLKTDVPKHLIFGNVLLAALYTCVIAFFFPKGNAYLYSLLIISQIYYLWQLIMYCHTIWDTEYKAPFDRSYAPSVDIFITVAGEPLDLIEATALAAKSMDYESFKVHILNDGYVAKKDNWQDVEKLARKLGINCITRKIAGGAKAGNINHGLAQTDAKLVAIFDADHVPHKDFLKKTVGYFGDPKMGFVQTPQYYKNHDLNNVTSGAWDQQKLFFGPICKGKNRLNAATMTGTNMVIRRDAFTSVGGMCEDNIAEDFLTGLFMHQKGWRSYYLAEVLAEGLAPEDFLSYYKQQYRWARGALEVVFNHNPLFKKGMTWTQKMHYLFSAGYFLSGIIVLINASMPLIFFFTGLVPFTAPTMLLALSFLPYIFITIYVLKLSSNNSFTFKGLAFSMSSFEIYLRALVGVISGRKARFEITAKRKVDGNFLNLVSSHILYLLLAVTGLGFAIFREGISASVSTNLAWALFNISVFLVFIMAAMPSLEISKNLESGEAIKNDR